MQPTVLAVCMHKHCRQNGSERVAAELERRLAKCGVDDRIQVKRNGCLGVCGVGCSVLLEPVGVTIARVRRKDVKALVRRQLAGKRPPKGLRLCLRGKSGARRVAHRLARAAFAIA